MSNTHQLLFSHPTGNANVRAALAGLYDAGLLKEFFTTVATYQGNLWDVLSRSQWGRDFQRRKFDERLKPITRQHSFRELGRMLTDRLNLQRLTEHETGAFCVDAVYQEQDRRTARHLKQNAGAFTGVYVYEDGALETLKTAKEHNLLGIYDLPIGHWRAQRRLMAHEKERVPEWAGTVTGFKDSQEKLDRKDGELATATRIIVASNFAAETLKEYPGKLPPPLVVPYGFPDVAGSDRPARGPATKEKPLRLLFVGGLSQRKGIADLFKAVNAMGAVVSLTVIGNKTGDDFPALEKELDTHRWIPSLPHDEIMEEMREHDVFVFPSLFEGFGLVISEAMSQGTPVITTERTAGPELITHGKNGWLVKAGHPEKLIEQLEKLVRDVEAVQEAGREARKTAAARPWPIYGQELAAAIMSFT